MKISAVPEGTGGNTDVTVLIQSELPRLSESLRRVGEAVLADPAGVARCSAAELSQRTGTSQATVTRFCRAIGLDSYQHLLIELAQEIGRGSTQSTWGTAEVDPNISPTDSLERVVNVVSNADLRAIQLTVERIDLDAIERAAQVIARARKVDVYGVGGSGAVADETETRLFRIGCPVRAWSEVHGALTSAALLTPADVAIGISHGGETRETYEPLQLAHQRGATVIGITNNPKSPIARIADIRLITSGMETTFRPDAIGARHSTLLLIDCVYVRVAQLTYERASASLALTDHIAGEHATPERRGPRGAGGEGRRLGSIPRK